MIDSCYFQLLMRRSVLNLQKKQATTKLSMFEITQKELHLQKTIFLQYFKIKKLCLLEIGECVTKNSASAYF